MKNLLFFYCIFCTVAAFAQPVSNTSELTIPQIMQGERFVGYLPENIFWGQDNETVYFSWNPEQDTLRSLYRVGLTDGEPEKVELEEQRLLPTSPGDYNDDHTQMLYTKGGDLFLLDLQSGEQNRLTHTVDRESNPVFADDENLIIFERANNLYVWDQRSGATRQLSNFKEGTERSERSLPTYRQWLKEQQMELFEVLRERETASELREQRQDSLELDMPKAVHYGDKRLSNLRASPDLNFVTCRFISRSDAKNTEVPYWVNEEGYVDNRNARPKVGSPEDEYELGIFDIGRDTFYTLDTEQIPGIFDKPAFLEEYHKDTIEYQEKYDKPRAVITHGPFFSEHGQVVIVIRSMDNKDRWIMQVNLPTGELKLLDRQRDEAWVGGPGISGWNFSAGTIGWLADNETIYFQSEETGYSHLYTLHVPTGKKKALTSGDWEVRETILSKDKNYFYLTTNRESPHEQHFYRLPVDGGELERITTRPGNHEVTLSPDESHLAIRYSYSNQPWDLYVMENRTGAEMQRLTNSTTEDFEAYEWREPEIIYFEAGDDAKVPARLYRPENAQPGGPAVIFVHGAGYLQNVHRWWSSYYREYMFHNMLVDNGYTVLDIDYRGSDGYGRDWRTGIYRHMGGKDLSDQVDGAAYLVEEYSIDPGRIGIYGGSYGGFITLMALFNAPETFRAGAALRSVTDWAHYNHPYTANILNTPVEDSIAYQRSSPINFAEGLQGNLVILHGMVDTNVQFQDVVRLSQRLIELGKDNWEFAVFPVEGHGFVGPSSWTDEYKRIFKLFQETLQEEK